MAWLGWQPFSSDAEYLVVARENSRGQTLAHPQLARLDGIPFALKKDGHDARVFIADVASGRRPMKVHDIMTRDAVSCQTDIDLASAARIMLKGRVGTLPVVDPHGCVTGMLTDRDIAMATGTCRLNAAHIAVHEIMSCRVRGCLAYDDVTAALNLMARARVRRLPVLDATGHLAGILSIDDILLRASARRTALRRQTS